VYREVYMGVSEGRILVLGDNPISKVTMEEVPPTLNLTKEHLEFLPATVERLEGEGRVVTDGPTYRLESWSVGQELCLRVSRRSYFDSVLLKEHPEWGLRSGVLAATCVLKCKDGYLIEKRSEKVAALPGRLHLSPSGSMVPPQHPRETVEQEAFEELGLEASELHDLVCLGLIYGERVGVFQLVCRATVNTSRAELEQRPCSGAWERSALMCAPVDPSSLKSWLEEHRGPISAAAFSALAMEGMRHWGEGWAKEILS
jgi:8-oxo-dGTP pyrophosphatase MutT (NUDIX family)